MARLVIGTNKTATTPAVVRDVAPAHYIEKTVSNGVLKNYNFINSLDGVTTIREGALAYCCYNDTTVQNCDMSNVTSINGAFACYSMFEKNTALTSINISNLQSVNGSKACYNMFFGCTGLIGELDLSGLQGINGYSPNTGAGTAMCQGMFSGCTGITSVKLQWLSSVQNGTDACREMFKGCTGLTEAHLDSINAASSQEPYLFRYMFQGCTNLTDLYLPYVGSASISSAVGLMLDGITGCKVHLPNNMSTILANINFGGTNTQKVFDLPAFLKITTADGKYLVLSPAYHTNTSLAWHETNSYFNAYGYKNLTTYYTSGTTDPAVSDTIYSDSACTVAVTTISSIA